MATLANFQQHRSAMLQPLFQRAAATLGKYWLNAEGEPERATDLPAWTRWYASAVRHVADTMVGDVRISTVFIGEDHSGGRRRHPVLWETLVLGGPHNGDVHHYASRGQAERGHLRIVNMIQHDAEAEDDKVRA